MFRKIFTVEEKESLKRLVAQYANIIENKKIDGVSVFQKKRAWNKLTVDYNSLPGNYNRSVQQLKKCWENMKNRKRDVLMEIKRYEMVTGGGSHIYLEEDVDDDVLNVVDIEVEESIDSDTLALAENDMGLYLCEGGVLVPQSEVSATRSRQAAAAAVVAPPLSIPPPEEATTTTIPAQPPPPSSLSPPSSSSSRADAADSSTCQYCQAPARGNALERELEERINRTRRGLEMDILTHEMRTRHEKELHDFKMQEMKEIHEIKKQHMLRMYRLEYTKAKAKKFKSIKDY